MEIAPVIDPNESRDERRESDLPEWTDATFTASLILDRRVDSHPSDASALEAEELTKRRRLDLSTTVAKTVVTAMGGRLIRRQSDALGDASGDQFSFTVPLLRTSRDESECDFVPVVPLPTGRTVGAVLLRARGAVGAGAMSANHVEHVASSLISFGARVGRCADESDAASQLAAAQPMTKNQKRRLREKRKKQAKQAAESAAGAPAQTEGGAPEYTFACRPRLPWRGRPRSEMRSTGSNNNSGGSSKN